MKKIVVVSLLIGLSVSLFALSPKIKKDQYMQGLDKSIEAKDYKQAKIYFKKVDDLAKINNLKLPSVYNYFKAKLYIEEKNYREANVNIEKYLDEAGSKGKYYTQSLDILNEIEQKLKLTYVQTSNQMWQDEIYTEKEITAYDDGYAYGKVQDWQGAKNYCSKLKLEGYSDWYLPTKVQLKTLFKNKAQLVNILPARYWSSSIAAFETTDAWRVRFDDGNTNYYNKSYFYYVRCTRDKK